LDAIASSNMVESTGVQKKKKKKKKRKLKHEDGKVLSISVHLLNEFEYSLASFQLLSQQQYPDSWLVEPAARP
jgi:hypothetical protein